MAAQLETISSPSLQASSHLELVTGRQWHGVGGVALRWDSVCWVCVGRSQRSETSYEVATKGRGTFTITHVKEENTFTMFNNTN